jgi:Ca-activated chloride channel family protein
MTAPFRQIAQDSGAYYVLAYDSPHVREHDGDFHEIRIRVKRSGVTVRARTGWYEPAS